ncbi:DUF6364 family protein [Caulobacter endophyticus]|uniref:DUF6364 family protein n=1 Tax=Caulobacter endophyticus TaxID=2172652 RepID=UPI00240EFF40|nr:DUF6364 family protein [Caulobacter endophyticus]MDG2529184.1 DUF6364 family protein [Caulobacter endophyticus]
MKNITVSIDDETYRRARIRAAEQETSVSAMVRKYLVEVAQGESEFERLKRRELELREKIRGFRAADNVPRDELYRRGE